MQRGTSHFRLRRRLVRCCVVLHYGKVKRRLSLLLLDITHPGPQGFPLIFEGDTLGTRKNCRGNWVTSRPPKQSHSAVQLNTDPVSRSPKNGQRASLQIWVQFLCSLVVDINFSYLFFSVNSFSFTHSHVIRKFGGHVLFSQSRLSVEHLFYCFLLFCHYLTLFCLLLLHFSFPSPLSFC